MDIVRISVARSGEVAIDGVAAAPQDLAAALDRVKNDGGAVYYYREAPQAPPTDQQLTVFKTIIDARVPIRLSAKPDFSDFVDDSGAPHP